MKLRHLTVDDAFASLQSGPTGLSGAVALRRLSEVGELNETRFMSMQHEHGTRSFADDLFRNAPTKEAVQSCPPMGCDNDKIWTDTAGDIENALCGYIVTHDSVYGQIFWDHGPANFSKFLLK